MSFYNNKTLPKILPSQHPTWSWGRTTPWWGPSILFSSCVLHPMPHARMTTLAEGLGLLPRFYSSTSLFNSYFMCMSLHLNVCLCTVHVAGAVGGQRKRELALTCCCPLPHPSIPSHFISPAYVPRDFSVSLSERSPVNSRELPSLFLFKRRLGRCWKERPWALEYMAQMWSEDSSGSPFPMGSRDWTQVTGFWWQALLLTELSQQL